MSFPLVRLASLDLIRGFVAVGRRMSITLAADDLCLTQSAISRQIQTLEARLGVKLFVRGYRSITFTHDGERLFRIADASLQQLQEVFGAVAATKERLPVTITASIGVAALWLLPRLTSFQQQHPEIDVRVAANNKLLDLRSEGVDLAIRYCRQSAAPEGAERLFGESVVAVAHPAVGAVHPNWPDNIADTVLLEYDDTRRPWLQWADRLAALRTTERPRSILRFNQYDQVIQAAVAGQGIALGRLALVTPMLEDGRLVAIESVSDTSTTELAYWLIKADEELSRDVEMVAAWIGSEARDLETRTPRVDVDGISGPPPASSQAFTAERLRNHSEPSP